MFKRVTPHGLWMIACVALVGCGQAATSPPAREAEAQAPDAELRELQERLGQLLRERVAARSNYEEARLAGLEQARRHDSLAAQYAKEHPHDPFYGPFADPGWRAQAEAAQVLNDLESEVATVRARIVAHETRK